MAVVGQCHPRNPVLLRSSGRNQSWKSSVPVHPLSVSPSGIVVQNVSGSGVQQEIWRGEGNRGFFAISLILFPPPAPRGETCLRVLAEVLSSARGGSVGCSSGSGWLQLIPTQREPRPSAHVLCYEQSGVVLVWGAPTTSSGLGNIDEWKEAGQDAASHSCFTC